MEAQERIYLNPIQDALTEMLSTKTDGDIEYIRKDAFVKKVVNFLEILGYAYTITDNITHTCYDKEQMIEDFKEYLKE